jgi:cytochrome bd ubiquinol oxidase subunit II
MWFSFLAFMITMYVVLDGFDLGVGAVHLFLGRSERERDEATAAIGPVWNGNEVWLIAAGGVLFMIFPKVYASAFSGLYFGLILALWLLVGRGLGLELRHQLDNPLWRQACDAVFAFASAGWRSFLERRSATSCAAFRWAPTAISISRCSTSSIGMPCSSESSA